MVSILPLPTRDATTDDPTAYAHVTAANSTDYYLVVEVTDEAAPR
jgi:hypothetical protein